MSFLNLKKIHIFFQNRLSLRGWNFSIILAQDKVTRRATLGGTAPYLGFLFHIKNVPQSVSPWTIFVLWIKKIYIY